MHYQTILFIFLSSLVAIVYSTANYPEITPPPQPARRQDDASAISEEVEETTALGDGGVFTRIASRDGDGLDLTATMVTTLLPDYDGLKASVVATDASPPMIIYPRSPGILALGAIGIVTYFSGKGLNDFQNFLEPDLQRVSLQDLQGKRPPGISLDDDDNSCSTVPKCSTCNGNTLSVCQSGTYKSCPCQSDSKCPKPSDRPKCLGTPCAGNEFNRCTKTGFEGCSCIGAIGNPTVVELYDPLWVAVQMNVLAMFQNEKDTCFKGNSPNPAPGYLMGTGFESAVPNDLLYRIREKICANQCRIPDQLPSNAADITAVWPHQDNNGECEISIALQNNLEAYMYRGTSAVDIEQQECYDFTQNLIDNCIQNRGNNAWENGPDVFQYYELGFRTLNGHNARHDPFSGINFLNSSFEIQCYTTTQQRKEIGNVNNVQAGAVSVCQSLSSQKLVMNSDNNQLPTDFPRQFNGASSNGDNLIYSLVWSRAACTDRTKPTDLDFTSYFQDQCVANFVSQGGATCLQGGSVTKDCAIWSVSAF